MRAVRSSINSIHREEVIIIFFSGSIYPFYITAIFGYQFINNVFRHFQTGAGTEKYICPEPGEGENQRVGGAAVFQIPPEGYFKSFDIVPFFDDGIEVQQGLGGVLVATVAGIDDRDTGIIGYYFSGAFPRMTDDDDIGVTTDYFGGIGDAFPFSQLAGADIRGGDDATAESVHGGFERQARAGARLEEQASHDFSFTQVELLWHIFSHFIC